MNRTTQTYAVKISLLVVGLLVGLQVQSSRGQTLPPTSIAPQDLLAVVAPVQGEKQWLIMEATKIDGKNVVSLSTNGFRILARSVTVAGGATILPTEEGIEYSTG